MSVFTITCPLAGLTLVELATAGFDRWDEERVNQSPGRFILFQTPAAWTGEPIIPHDAAVTIRKDGTIIFRGICLSDHRAASGVAHDISYILTDPWYWLDEIGYRQLHKRYVSGALADVLTPKVILCQALDGSSIGSAAQIAAIIDFAISQGAPIARGVIEPDLEIPWEQATDLKCSEAIRRLLRWSPDAATYWDFTTALPTLHIVQSGSMTPQSVDLNAYLATDAKIQPRYDLQRPGVQLVFETTTTATVDGASSTWITVTTDDAGDVSHPRCLRSYVTLTNSASAQNQVEQIVTEYLPGIAPNAEAPYSPDWLDKDWWRLHMPALRQYDAADMTISAPFVISDLENMGQPGHIPSSDLPRMLVSGQVQPWMAAAGIKAAEVKVSVLLAAIERDATGQIIHEFTDREITLSFIGTDALTQAYSRLLLAEASFESIPNGLAAALYASLSRLEYDGQLTLVDRAAPDRYYPGQVFNLLNGRDAWATMAAVVQTVSIQYATGTTQIVIGPPKHLGPDDLVALLRRFRTRGFARDAQARVTGDAATTAAHNGGLPPKVVPGVVGAGSQRRTVYERVDGSYPDRTQRIIVDPEGTAALAGGVDVIIQPRKLLCLSVGSEGVITAAERIVLCSEPIGSTVLEMADLNVVTDNLVNLSLGAFQHRRRAIRVFVLGSETTFTTITNGEGEDCPT